MKVLLTGAAGQLGHALLTSRPTGVKIIATSRTGGPGLLALDLADAESCAAAVIEHKPDWVINAGAYTAVDQAEREAELAFAVNAAAPEAFAHALAKTGGKLLQLSTDFVFDGRQSTPYRTDQLQNPINVYGASKATGEAIVQAVLPSTKFCIMRTSWVYGPVGRNFLLTMLKLHKEYAEQGKALSVVLNQVGSPTATSSLSQACWRAITKQIAGIHHWQDAGVTNWYEFAIAIGELAAATRIIEKSAVVKPISSKEFNAIAKRPAYSVLDCSPTKKQLGMEPMHWKRALFDTMKKIKQDSARITEELSNCPETEEKPC